MLSGFACENIAQRPVNISERWLEAQPLLSSDRDVSNGFQQPAAIQLYTSYGHAH